MNAARREFPLACGLRLTVEATAPEGVERLDTVAIAALGAASAALHRPAAPLPGGPQIIAGPRPRHPEDAIALVTRSADGASS
jgi:hypothetical protein